MSNISSGKMFSYINRVFGEHKPITADFFLNNFCNNRCPYCTYRRWEHEPGARSMSFDDFVTYALRVLDLGVRGIILTGGGEPTISKDFDLITEWMEARGIHYGINTNFNLIRFIKPDYLKVSLDGWDEDSYEAHRGVRAYNQVRENIICYSRWKAENSPKTSLGIQMLATSAKEVKLFYEANKDLPVDYISIRPMESTGGKYYKNTELPLDMQPKTICEVIKQYAEIDPRVVMNFKWNMLDVQEEYCIAQWAQIALNEKGEVIYCCHKPYQIVGHILDDNILEKKERAMTNMSMCDIPCRMTAPNHEVKEMLRERKDIAFI